MLDEFGNPLVVVEAKKEKIEPLFAKEQAGKRKNYSKTIKVLHN